jgi:WD40 repeat protein
VQASCFDSYREDDPAAEPFKRNRGQVIFTRRRGEYVYSHNLASGETRQLTDDAVRMAATVPLSLSDTGRYVQYLREERFIGFYFNEVATGMVSSGNALQGEAYWLPGDVGYMMITPFHLFLVMDNPLADYSPENAIRTDGTPHNVTWSDDGRRVAAQFADRVEIYTTAPLALEREIKPSTAEGEGSSDGVNGAVISPDGKHIVVRMNRPEREEFVYQLINLDTGSAREVMTSHNIYGGDPDIAWSPSSRFVTLRQYRMYDSYLHIYDVQEQRLSKVEDGEDGGFLYRWAPTADRLLFAGAGSEGLFLVNDPATARSRRVATADEVDYIAWSPNSRYFVYQAYRAGIGLDRYSDDALAEGCTVEVPSIDGQVTWSPSGQYLLYRTGDADFEVMRPDGSEHMPITGLFTDMPGLPVRSAGWTSESDTVFGVHKDPYTTIGEAPLEFIEIDSLSVSNAGVEEFANLDYSMLFGPGP